MNEMIQLSTQIHVGSILFMIFVTLFMIVTFSTESDYVLLTKKHERYSLIYFFFLSVAIFTGLILFAVSGLHWSLKVVLMIMAVMHMIVTSIKLHIFFKSSRIYDKKSQEDFRRYTRKKYFMDIIVLIVIGFVSYAIHI